MQEKGNHILVNVSGGSKIQAIASMMACMMFKEMATIKPYYVVPEKYTNLLEEKKNQETEGMKDVITLPEYKRQSYIHQFKVFRLAWHLQLISGTAHRFCTLVPLFHMILMRAQVCAWLEIMIIEIQI